MADVRAEDSDHRPRLDRVAGNPCRARAARGRHRRQRRQRRHRAPQAAQAAPTATGAARGAAAAATGPCPRGGRPQLVGPVTSGSMNPFWIGGAALFIWALILAFALGLRSEGFPRDDRQMRGVLVISVALTIAAIATAIIGGITGAGETKGLRHGPEVAKHSE